VLRFILSNVTPADQPEEHSEPDPASWPHHPTTGEITEVSGRRVEGGQRGLPALETLSLLNADGSTLEFGPPGRGESDTLMFVAEIPANDFRVSPDSVSICPICVVGAATAKEHVPQRALGGSAMTTTCQPCNNGLGSKIEAPLQDWFDYALTRVAFEHDGEVPGRRRVPKMYLREGSDNTFMLFIDGELESGAEQIFKAGNRFNMNHQLPHPRTYSLALLKHAYLAACLHLGNVPDTEEARAIREALIAARDAPKGQAPPESEAAKRLTVYRSGVGRQGPPLALVGQHQPDGSEPQFLISLAGVLFVTWPFADSPPGYWRRASKPGDASA